MIEDHINTMALVVIHGMMEPTTVPTTAPLPAPSESPTPLTTAGSTGGMSPSTGAPRLCFFQYEPQ